MKDKKYYSISMLCIDTDDTFYVDMFYELFDSKEKAIKIMKEHIKDFITENNSMEMNLTLTGYYASGDDTQREIYYDNGIEEKLITRYNINEHIIKEGK